jgi:hypothetical protein
MPKVAWLAPSGVWVAQCDPVCTSGMSEAAGAASPPADEICSAQRAPKLSCLRARAVNDVAVYDPPPLGAVTGQVIV